MTGWVDGFSGFCAWCGESFEVEIDPSGGRLQQMVEDCWVCCRPNVVRVVIDAEGGAEVELTQE